MAQTSSCVGATAAFFRTKRISRGVFLAMLSVGTPASYAADYAVTAPNDDGTGAVNTLSWAIGQSNAGTGTSTITIGSPITTLFVTGVLPSIARPVTITSGGHVVIFSLLTESRPLLTLTSTLTFDTSVGVTGGNGRDGGPGEFLGGSGYPGDVGGAGVSGSGFVLINKGNVTAGNGGHGHPGNAGAFLGRRVGGQGGFGGDGAAGVSGTDFTITNNAGGTITGGKGGKGGDGGPGNSGFELPGDGGNGGRGGGGGAGVSSTDVTITNNKGGIITGGDGGNGGKGGDGGLGIGSIGNGGNGGSGGNGGAAVSGSNFTLTNTGSVRGGNGASAGPGGSGSATGSEGSLGVGGVGVISTGKSTIFNGGVIASGEGRLSANAIEFSGGGNKLVIESGSIITGNVVSTSGSANGGDTLTLGGVPNAIGGNAFNLGQLGAQYRGFRNYGKEGTSTWTLTGTGGALGDSWTVSAGTLGLAAGTSLTGNVSISNSGAMLGDATARITGNVSNAGSLAVGSATTPQASLTITGDFINSGTFSPAIAGMTSYGMLIVSGNATLGGTLDVNVIGTPTLTSGETLAGVIHAGAVSGTFSMVQDNSYLFNFTPVYTGTDVSLNVVAAVRVLDAVTSTGSSAATGAAAVFDRLISAGPSGNADMDSVIKALARLTDARSVSDAVSQTLPLLGASQSLAVANALRGTSRVVQTRQESTEGGSSGDEFFGAKYFWIKPFGSWADQDDRKGVSGYRAVTHGLVLGADAELSESNRLGIAFAYARSNVDSNSSIAPQSSNVDSYQAVLYGSHSIDNSTDLNLQAGIGRHNTTGIRSIPFLSRVAQADYHSRSAHIGGGVSHALILNENTRFTPALRADYSIIRDDGYTETGSGSLNLNVDRHTVRELIVAVEGKLAHALTDKVMLTANLGAGYDVLNEAASITSAFAGASSAAFATKGLDPSPWMLRGGLALVSKPSNAFELSARYGFEVRKGFANQTASVQLRWAF